VPRWNLPPRKGGLLCSKECQKKLEHKITAHLAPKKPLMLKEVVLFVGPPCSNASHYFHVHYGSTHELVSVRDHWLSNSKAKVKKSEMSLHIVCKRLIAKLNEKPIVRLVFLSGDDNYSSATRASMIQKLKQSVTGLRVCLVWFRPSLIQCMWQNELNIAADDYVIQGNSDVASSDVKMNSSETRSINWMQVTLDYFSSSATVSRSWQPDEGKEALDELREVTMDYSTVKYRTNLSHFNHHALFIDAHAFLNLKQHDSDSLPEQLKVRSKIKVLLRAWTNTKIHSRIIVVMDHNRLFDLLGVTLPNDANELIAKKKLITKLVRKSIAMLRMPFPIYYICGYNQGDCSTNNFFATPNSGMIAYCQYIHSLDIGNSLYVSEKTPIDSQIPFSFEDCSITDRVGVSVIQYSKLDLSKKNDMEIMQQVTILSISCMNAPSFVTNLQISLAEKEKRTQSIDKFPLLQKLKQSSFYCVEQCGTLNRVHGIVLDSQFIDNFVDQNSFEKNVSGYAQLEYQKLHKKGIASEQPPLTDVEPAPIDNSSTKIHPEESSHLITDTKSGFVDYFGYKSYEGGQSLIDSVFEIRVKPVRDKYFKLYSRCYSTKEASGANYRQESLFKNGHIIKSVCTCPDGKDGRCKHSAASVLHYDGKTRHTIKSEHIDQAYKVISTRTLNSEKSLPAWMRFEMKEKHTELTNSGKAASPKEEDKKITISNSTVDTEPKRHQINSDQQPPAARDELMDIFFPTTEQVQSSTARPSVHMQKQGNLTVQHEHTIKPTSEGHHKPLKHEFYSADSYEPPQSIEITNTWNDTGSQDTYTKTDRCIVNSPKVQSKNQANDSLDFADIFFAAAPVKKNESTKPMVDPPPRAEENKVSSNRSATLENIFFSSTKEPKSEKNTIVEKSQEDCLEDIFFGARSKSRDNRTSITNNENTSKRKIYEPDSSQKDTVLHQQKKRKTTALASSSSNVMTQKQETDSQQKKVSLRNLLSQFSSQ